jgi:peptidylprolyl isomerase
MRMIRKIIPAIALLSVSLFMVGNASATQATLAQQQAPVGDLENTLYLNLKDGQVIIKLLPDQAPETVARIKELVRQGFYNGIVFHRVIDGFMAQGGDPTGTGTGGSGQKIPDEFPASSAAYKRGAIAMANAGPGTSDSQFFILFKDYQLPPQYTVFGKVISGMEYVDSIKKGDPYGNGKVTSPDKIVSMQVVADVKKAADAAPAAQ